MDTVGDHLRVGRPAGATPAALVPLLRSGAGESRIGRFHALGQYHRRMLEPGRGGRADHMGAGADHEIRRDRTPFGDVLVHDPILASREPVAGPRRQASHGDDIGEVGDGL